MTATDISEDMVATANKTASDVSNMATMVADAQNLEAFEDNSMDQRFPVPLFSIPVPIPSQ